MIKTINIYGYIGAIRLILDRIYSKNFVSREITIIRLPFYKRGIKHIKCGKNFTSGVNIRIDIFSKKENKSHYLLEIGVNESILPRVNIDKGSIIGANSFVSNNIPPYFIAFGNPAKQIKKYNFENDLREKL